MKVITWYRENFVVRPDWKFRVALVLPGSLAFQLGVYLTSAVWNPILFLVLVAYLLFGVDYLADRRLLRKAEREARQMARAEEFEERLDKSFGLDK